MTAAGSPKCPNYGNMRALVYQERLGTGESRPRLLGKLKAIRIKRCRYPRRLFYSSHPDANMPKRAASIHFEAAISSSRRQS